ncbi:MAG TPA: DUF6804 family protein [Puia sp.]|nr:DUF6804 family protein [Puia sp.]
MALRYFFSGRGLNDFKEIVESKIKGISPFIVINQWDISINQIETIKRVITPEYNGDFKAEGKDKTSFAGVLLDQDRICRFLAFKLLLLKRSYEEYETLYYKIKNPHTQSYIKYEWDNLRNSVDSFLKTGKSSHFDEILIISEVVDGYVSSNAHKNEVEIVNLIDSLTILDTQIDSRLLKRKNFRKNCFIKGMAVKSPLPFIYANGLFFAKIFLRLVLSALFVGCLYEVPNNYYQLVKFTAFVFFIGIGYADFKRKNYVPVFLSATGAIFFNPFYKVTFEQDEWVEIDQYVICVLMTWTILEIVIFLIRRKKPRLAQDRGQNNPV